MSSLQSYLLIANGELAEPFQRAVVLLVRHNDEGALGLILNRRTTATLKDAWSKLSQVPCHREESLFLGGPCEGPLVALHSRDALGEMEVMGGLYFSAGKEKLERLAAQKGGPAIKFFANYSGWSAGQLEAEIAQGSWTLMPAALEHVFAFEGELWEQVRRQATDIAWRSALKIKHAPRDPSAN